MNWEEKYLALAELVDGYRRERDEAREEYADARASRWHIIKERDALMDEVDRLSESAKAAWDSECFMRNERDEARAERDNLLDTRSEGAWMARALDAERMAAEAEKLSDAAKAAWDAECIMREQRDRFHAEWKQERQEVERLRVELIRAGSRECDIAACNCGTWHHQNPRAAYRRGAEAMRKRCAMWIKHNSHEDGLGMGSQRIESALAALPIPEEP